jgi:hypothetical protein
VCCKNHHENRKKENKKGMEIGKMKDEMKFKIFLREKYIDLEWGVKLFLPHFYNKISFILSCAISLLVL